MTTRLESTSAVLDSQILGGYNVDPATTTGLTLGLRAGAISSDGTADASAASTIAMVDDSTNIVYIAGTTISVGAAMPANATHPLFEVVAASGVITSITDLRMVFK